jgi:hypothetical protein
MMAIDSVMLHRKDDPSHEYREIILYQAEGHFAVWVAVSFLKDPNFHQRSQVDIGSETEMRDRFNAEIERLKAEGFTKLDARSPEPLQNH